MSDLFQNRHALGFMVLRLFPKVMQTILKHYVNPPWLKRKYLKQDFRFVFTDKEIVLMDKLPNMDEFTIEICYKILRFENMLDEPKCKWDNVPHDTEVEIADDIQRLINATNSIINIKSEEVTELYAEKLLKEIELMVTRIDSYLEQDTLGSLYKSLFISKTDFPSIVQELTMVKAIVESLTNTESEKRERYSRLSIPIIEIFPNILRHVIRTNMSAKLLYQKCVPVLNTFYPEQQKNIKELQYSNTYGSLDVTLIYQLLRKFSLIPSPTNGWGRLPDKVDINLGDDVERIRCYRNKLAHRSDTDIDKNEFNEYFDEFRGIGYRMDLNFSQGTNYEQQIIGYRTCGMDTAMQAKYENAMKEVENIRLRFEKRPIKFFWGDDFDKCLKNLRSLLTDEILEGRQKVRVQIIFQNEDDVERIITILNSLKEEINEGLCGIEFIVATKGSVVLNVDILLEVLETDDQLLRTLALFVEKIMECIPDFSSETIDIVLLPVEENTQWNKPKTTGEQVYLEFDIEAQLLKTDDKLVEQLGNISDAILKHSKESGTNQKTTVTLLPFNLENISTKEQSFAHAETAEGNKTSTEESFNKAQTPVKNNLPVSVNLRKQLDIKRLKNEMQMISSCIKIGKTLVFIDFNNNQIIICNVDGTDIHHIKQSIQPFKITKVDSNTVAISCRVFKTILILNISTRSVTSKIKTSGDCDGISYDGNNLYVVIGDSIIHVMDLTGKKVMPTIDFPSVRIRSITVHRDRLVYIDAASINCCSSDGKLMWKFQNDKYQELRRVTTDDEGNVYVTNWRPDTVLVLSDNGKCYKELLSESNGLDKPNAIHFDKKENILLVCNFEDRKCFLFDVKKRPS